STRCATTASRRNSSHTRSTATTRPIPCGSATCSGDGWSGSSSISAPRRDRNDDGLAFAAEAFSNGGFLYEVRSAYAPRDSRRRHVRRGSAAGGLETASQKGRHAFHDRLPAEGNRGELLRAEQYRSQGTE